MRQRLKCRSLRHRHYFALTMAAQDAEEQGNAPLMITSPMLHECGHPRCSRLTTGGKFLSCCSLCASSTVLTTNGHTPDCDTRNGISTTPPQLGAHAADQQYILGSAAAKPALMSGAACTRTSAKKGSAKKGSSAAAD
jgi:hypothetical protein